MITSMTAYARAVERTNSFEADIEVRTYNSRHLDFSIRVPHGYSPVEEKIKAVVNSTLARGRVEIKLIVRDESEAAHAFEVNEQKATAYRNALKDLAELTGVENNLSLEMIAGVPGILAPAEKDIDLDKEWPVIETCLKNVLDDIVRMRQVEGDNLKQDFNQRLVMISTAVDSIESASSGLLTIYKERLTDRIARLTDGVMAIEEDRIIQEAAVMADKSDISEEIVRARSHIGQFYEIMKSAEPGGRKLNFLLQEFNREFNTMGSKIGKADIAHVIVDIKAELEKMREQIQNVE